MMRARLLLTILCVFALYWGWVQIAAAQTPPAAVAIAEVDPWPPVSLSDSTDPHAFDRGPGWYISLAKIFFFWMLVLLWIRTADWINRDCQTYRLDYMVWNSVAIFPFFIAVLITWLLPFYGVGLILMILAYAGSLGAYVFLRNQQVEVHQKVFTPEHLRHVFSAKAKKVGVKVDSQKKAAYDEGPAVEFAARGGATDRDNTANLLTARQMPGFVAAKEQIAEAITARSDAMMLDFSAEAVAVRHQIDGVWHAAQPRDRATGDGLLAVFKTLAALNAGERVARQDGSFQANFKGKWTCRLLSQGTATGERVVIKVETGKISYHHLTELGMREKVAEQFLGILNGSQGMVVLCAMPAGGLSTLLSVTLEESDRLMRNFVALEDERTQELNIENVEVKTYQSTAGQTPLSILPEVLKSYPEVLVIPSLPDAANISAVCSEISEENRTVLTTVRAKEAPEALLRLLMLKPPVAEYAAALTAALNVRLIRRLCDQCKVAFQPTPDLLQKLGIPAGRVPHLYREPTLEERPQPCPACRGVGYVGRTGLFELLVVDDKVRQVLVSKPNMELLKKVARSAGMRTLQEEGILLVAKGVTSVPELMRVLKQ